VEAAKIRRQNVDDSVKTVTIGLDRIVKSAFPYSVRNLYMTAPVDRDMVVVKFKKPPRIPYYIAPSTAGSVIAEIYKSTVRLSEIRLGIWRRMLLEATYKWETRSRVALWNNTPGDWGLFLLASPTIYKEIVEGNAEIVTNNEETREYFDEFLEALDLMARSDRFRAIKPQDFLNQGRPLTRVEVRIWRPVNEVDFVRIAMQMNGEPQKLTIKIDFLRYGKGWIEWDGGRAHVSAYATTEERVLRYLEKMDIPYLLEKHVRPAFKDFVEAYAKVAVALRYLEM
jgi:hypothetical protein